MMTANGLAKLMEECGELTQVAAKKMACPNTDEHWDGAGSLKTRMEEEIADVMAACEFVIGTHQLDQEKILRRAVLKVRTFQQWHANPHN